MSVLSRYTIREILSHLLAVFAVILGIFLVQRFASLLADASEGSLPIDAISRLLVLRTLMALPSLFPVTIYIAILLALGRFYEDLEMTALASCGVSPARMRRAVVAFAALAALLNGVLSFSVRPWAAARFQSVRQAAMTESELDRMRPRRFYAIDQGEDEVIFADSRSELDPAVLQDVFVQVRGDAKVSVFTAKLAVEERNEARGYRFLRLFEGHRYDLDTRRDDHQITTYQELSIRAALPGTAVPEREETRSALALASSTRPRDAAELQWRIANAVSVLLLALIAIPLSHTNPRRGKYAKLFVAILFYVAYRNLLGTARHWIEDGALPFLPGLWLVHGLALAAALVLFSIEPERRQRWTWAFRFSQKATA
jgi:lipopolysaccharide export system permease protein